MPVRLLSGRQDSLARQTTNAATSMKLERGRRGGGGSNAPFAAAMGDGFLPQSLEASLCGMSTHRLLRHEKVYDKR